MDGDGILIHEELEAKERKLKSLFGHNNAYLFRIGMNSGSVPDTHSLKSTTTTTPPKSLIPNKLG
jgi:hypothetical protein